MTSHARARLRSIPAFLVDVTLPGDGIPEPGRSIDPARQGRRGILMWAEQQRQAASRP